MIRSVVCEMGLHLPIGKKTSKQRLHESRSDGMQTCICRVAGWDMHLLQEIVLFDPLAHLEDFDGSNISEQDDRCDRCAFEVVDGKQEFCLESP